MGYAVTWFAVREEQADALLRQLDLTPTGETEEIPESEICMARLPSGWRVIWYNEYDCPFLQHQDLYRLSSDTDVLVCKVEEHMMASSSELWSQRQQQWWLAHQGEDGPKGLQTRGDLPDSFPAIRKELEEEQRAAGGLDAEVDCIFDIPLRVAQSIVGFKHDEDCELVDGHFLVLTRHATGSSGTVSSSSTRGGFLRKLFGR